MKYRKLGASDLEVSEISLGSWLTYGVGVEAQKARGCLDTAFDVGINFIDTANVYGLGQSERLTGQALKNLGVARGEVVIATKVFGETSKGPNGRGLSRYHVMEAVKASLQRLQLDHVDLYQVHGFDAATPVEEIVRALDTLVQHGHVRYIGVSNWAAWHIVKALGVSERLGFARFASLQAYYTIAGRDIERELVPLLQSEGLALLVWSPLAGGLLSGKYSREGTAESGSRRTTFDFPPVDLDRAWSVIDVMRAIAAARSVSVAQVALAWLLHQPAVTSVIIGAKRLDQLNDNMAATAVRLSADELTALNAASELPQEYPGWMIARQGTARRAQLDGQRA